MESKRAMENKITYAHQVVGNAVDKLALGRGAIRERLREAYIELRHTKEENIPEEIRDDYRYVVDKLTGGGGQADAGQLQAVLDRMSDEECVAVGYRLRQLEDRFNMYLREQEEKE